MVRPRAGESWASVGSFNLVKRYQSVRKKRGEREEEKEGGRTPEFSEVDAEHERREGKKTEGCTRRVEGISLDGGKEEGSKGWLRRKKRGRVAFLDLYLRTSGGGGKGKE